MIQTIIYNNPINNVEESLNIDLEFINVDINKWHTYLYLLNNKSIYDILNDYLKDLDCTRIFKSGRPMMIEYPQYKIIMAEYIRFLNKISSFIIYNEYIDKLIQRHIDNILFEFNNPIVKKKPTNSKKQKIKPNKWVRLETDDLFTGERKYIYENLKTGETITSGNPNLLETFNNSKKKVKKEKVEQPKIVSMNGLIFNFKKKI